VTLLPPIDPGTVKALLASGHVVVYKPRRREVWIDGYKRRNVDPKHHGAMIQLCQRPPVLEA
jgi:hypothetical protein